MRVRYHLESNFKSISNKQHHSSTHTKVHVFDAIHNDFMRNNTKIAFILDILTDFHLKFSPQSLHSQNVSRVSNFFICLMFFRR